MLIVVKQMVVNGEKTEMLELISMMVMSSLIVLQCQRNLDQNPVLNQDQSLDHVQDQDPSLKLIVQK
jgi:hypothetical protein